MTQGKFYIRDSIHTCVKTIAMCMCKYIISYACECIGKRLLPVKLLLVTILNHIQSWSLGSCQMGGKSTREYMFKLFLFSYLEDEYEWRAFW